MSNLNELLFENTHYTVSVQDVTDANDKVSRGYSVRNKSTDVTEYESFSLVECMMFSRDMSTHLSEFQAEQEVNDLH